MDPVAFPIDLFWGCPQRTQDGLSEGQGHFPLAREHALRTRLVQGGDLTHIRRTGQDPDGGVQLSCQPDDLRTGAHASSAENEATSPLDPGVLQCPAMMGIAVHG